MKTLTILLAATVVALGLLQLRPAPVVAQAGAAGAMSVAVVDLQALLNESDHFKKMQDAQAARAQELQAELQKKQGEVKAAQNQLDALGPDTAAWEAKRREVLAMAAQAQAHDQIQKQIEGGERAREFLELYEKANAAIAAVAKERGVDVVMAGGALPDMGQLARAGQDQITNVLPEPQGALQQRPGRPHPGGAHPPQRQRLTGGHVSEPAQPRGSVHAPGDGRRDRRARRRRRRGRRPRAGVDGLAMLHEAKPGELSFVASQPWASRYAATRAGAVMVGRGITLPARDDGHDAAVVRVEDADLGMARLLEAIAPAEGAPPAGRHPRAEVDPSAEIGAGVSLGAGCTVGARARIGDGCVLHAGSHVYDDSVLGPGCVLWPGVVVRERCVIGARLLAHANVVIGADGFGFRGDVDDDGRPMVRKVPHLGHVEIGDDVELGACTCVDKGKFGSTRIGHQTKIDNHVQVGHNVVIGNLVVISGCCAIAGSCVIGDGVMVGGATAFADHVTVGPGTKLAGGSQVMGDVPAGVEWGGIPAQLFKDRIRQEVAVRKLPELLRKLKRSGIEL